MYFWRQIRDHMKTAAGVILLGVLSLLTGCTEEQKTYAAEDLTGHWEVFAAQRNGKETTLLNGAVFQFGEQYNMQTNFTGRETEGSYTLEQDVIELAGDPPMRFEIVALHGDSLTLKTAVQAMHFVLDLKRATTE